jgi:hypothetical protein
VANCLQGLRDSDKLQICFYAAPFGVIPLELDEVYPLSQHEAVLPLDHETKAYVADSVANYISHLKSGTLVMLEDPQNWGKSIVETAENACLKKKIRFQCINLNGKKGEAVRVCLKKVLHKS